MNSKFEFVSLGADCNVKFNIKSKFTGDQITYPFDWVITHDFRSVREFISTRKYDKFLDFGKFADLTKYDFRLEITCNFSDLTLREVLKHIDIVKMKALIRKYNSESGYLMNDYYQDIKKCAEAAIAKVNNSEVIYGTQVISDEHVKKYVSDNGIQLSPPYLNIDKYTIKLLKNVIATLTNNNMGYVHDHHIDTKWSIVSDKYARRFSRFLKLSELNKPIIFVRYDYYGKTNNVEELFSDLRGICEDCYLVVTNLNKNQTEQYTVNQKINDRCTVYSVKGPEFIGTAMQDFIKGINR